MNKLNKLIIFLLIIFLLLSANSFAYAIDYNPSNILNENPINENTSGFLMLSNNIVTFISTIAPIIILLLLTLL